MQGWIKIHREILNHWIFQSEKHFRWWCIILLSVNHDCVKFPVGEQIYSCNPGESFRSLEGWAQLFGCSKKTVVKFFHLLENDNMIKREIIGKGNRRKHLLTVVNWQKYQQKETENYLERKLKTTRNGNRTLPPNNNEKEMKKNERKKSPSNIFLKKNNDEGDYQYEF